MGDSGYTLSTTRKENSEKMNSALKSYKRTIAACYLAYITQSIIVNLAPVLFIVFRELYGLSYEMLGSLVLVNFVTQIFTDIISIKYADKIGYRVCSTAALTLSAVGLVLLALLPVLLPQSLTYAALITATVIYAVGSGMIEVLASPIVEALPTDAKASSMAMLHGFYCWGQMAVVLITTLLLKLFGHESWSFIPILWAIVPIVDLILFAGAPLPEPESKSGSMPLKSLLTSKVFIIALLLMTCSGAAEQAMAQWASMFAEKGLGVSKLTGDLLGPCLFAAFMGSGRTLFGVFGAKLDLRKTLFGCSALCVICYLCASLSPWPVLSLAGCAITGLSVSLMWPGMLSLASERFAGGGTPMFGALAVFGDLGCSIGPWMTGMISGAVIGSGNYGADIAESVGLKAGLLAAIIFPITMMIGVAAIKGKGAKKKE